MGEIVLGGPGPAPLVPARVTIRDEFDPSFFEYDWWERGVIERKPRILLVGQLVGTEEDEKTSLLHRMLHRLADFCNHHTVVLLSTQAERGLCKVALPRIYVRDSTTTEQEWVIPTAEEFSAWVQTAALDELKLPPLLSHSNWTLE